MSAATLGSRALFPDLEARAYLNHASIAPPSQAVQEALRSLLGRYAAVGTAAFPEAMETRGRLKDGLARLLGCDAADLALTSSATRGLTDLTCCLAWKPGDRILVFRGEFPGNTTPWRETARATGAELVWIDQEGRTDAELLADVEAAVAEGVAMIAVSLVQFATGRRMPVRALADLAHRAGGRICVDAIQAVGVVPVDVHALDADFLVGGAHKWLMGLEGVGYLYAHPRTLDTLRPRTANWLSHTEPLAFLMEGPGHLPYDQPIRRSIDFLEGTSSNALGCAGLEASVQILLELGVEAIAAHVATYLDALEDGLRARGFTSLRDRSAPSGTLAVLPPDGDSVGWSDALNAAGVAVSPPDGKLRIAPHWPNALDEVPLVLGIVDGILAAR